MAYQISPGVNVTEVDLTTVVPSVLTTAGAFTGTFQWGPVNKIKLIDNEITLAKTFGEPNTDSAISFFTAANFLAYGNNLSVVRVVGSTALNSSDGDTLKVDNEEQFELTKSSRLLLHAQSLSFEYKGIPYKIESTFDAKTIFYNLMKG